MAVVERSPDAVPLALLRRHGRDTTSFQLLAPGMRGWGDEDAGVGFVEVGGAWVAAGGPVCAPERAAAVVGAFCAAAGRRRVRFFAAEQGFPELAGWVRLQVGAQPVWEPARWAATVAASRSLREQLRRARAKGVQITPWTAAEVVAGRAELAALVGRWRASRPMAPMGFLVDVQLEAGLAERRTFVALRAGRVVGVLSLAPIYARSGWFFEHLIRDPGAPNGTTESLVDAAMRAVAAEGAEHVTLGMAPLAGVSSPWLRAARAVSRPLYDFAGLQAFKQKLRPDRWEPVFLVYPARERGLVAMLDVLRAFARGGFVRFGVATALHSAPRAAVALAALLVVWTGLLASADTAAWFPSVAVQRAWVVFDVGMAAGLLRLGWRWRRDLATLLACLAACDAALTTVEALVFNLPRGGGPVEVLVVLASMAAPALAAAFLWAARGHDGAEG